MKLVERVYAQTESWNFFDWDVISTQGSNTSNVFTLVTNVIQLILTVAGAAAIIYLIYSGILYITAAGNPDAAKKGQQGIINSVIGIVIIVLAYFIAIAVHNYAVSNLGT